MKKILVGLFAFCCMMSGSAQRFFPVNEKATATKPMLSTSVSDKQAQVYPFVFIENAGQVLDVDQNFHPEVKYMYSKDYNAMYFEKNRIVCVFAVKDTYNEAAYAGNQDAKDSICRTLGMQTQRIDIEFVGASENVEVIPGEKGTEVYHYFLNKRENISNVAVFNSVTYKNVYPQTDVVFYSFEGGIKYDIILHPGARIEDVKIRYHGASSLRLENNTVNIETALYNFSEELPLAYFNDDRNLKADVFYTVDGDVIQYSCAYTNTDKLTIDPTLTWATYYETSGAAGTIDYDHNVTDAAGNLFISGYCNNSANTYPTVSPGGTAYVQVWTSNDLYIAKFDPNRTLVWATYFGGANSSMDWALGTEVMAVSGNVLHIVGDELATDAPFLNGGGFYYNAGSSRPYYLRFDKTSGQLLHCTNISGGYHPSIAVSQSGLVAIMLHAYDFNTVHVVNRAGAYNQATNGGFTDLFLMLLNSSYTQIWGTFLGGPGTQENGHVAFDSNDNIFFSSEVQWMSGSTAATEHLVNPAGGAYYQTTYSGEDIMFGKFTSTGALYWNTLYGGNGNDGLDDEMGNGTKVIVNPANELLVIGGTSSTDFPLLTLAGAYNQTCPANINTGGSYDDFASFILKFSNTGVRQWSTYWGENSATSWALLYDGKFTSCNQFVVAARAVYAPVSFPGYYNKSTGGQSFLMLFNSSYATEWSSYIGDNTSTPQICYSPFENRLYLTTNTYASQATVDPGGGAYYDGVKTGSSCYSIWEFNMVPAPTLTGTDTLCAGTTTTWTASVSGGTWSSSNTGVATINPATGFINAVADGTTTITYSSTVSGCPVTATEQLTVANVNVTASAASPSICSGSSTTVSASGATSYSWSSSGSGSSFSASPSSTTTYTVTGTTSGCSNVATVTVTVNALPNVTATAGSPTICNGGSSLVTASGASSYSWSPTGSGSSFSASPSSTTTYTVTGTTSGCTAVATVTVTVNAAPSIAASATIPTICEGASTTISATGGTTYNWSHSLGSNASYSVNPSATTTYTVTGTSGGCTNVATVTVNVNSLPAISASATDVLICNGESTTISALGGTSYNWSGLGTNSSYSVNPSTTTTYTVTGTSGGCSNTATVLVTVNAIPNITAAATYPSLCVGESTPISAAGGSTYTWDNALGAGSTHNVTPSTTTTYHVTGTDANGCTSTAQVTVTITTAPSVSAIAGTTSLCLGSSTTLNGSGAVNYTWDQGLGSGGSFIISPTTTTTYHVTGASATGCSATAQVTVTVNAVPADPTAAGTPSQICLGESTTISASGSGSVDYEVYSAPTGGTYLGDASLVVSPTTTTVYYVQAVNSFGCANTGGRVPVTIIVNPLPVLPSVSASDTTICAGQSVALLAGGSGSGVVYEVWSALTGGTNLGYAPMMVNPSTTTTYYVQAVTAAGCTPSGGRVGFTFTVNPVTDAAMNPAGPFCISDAATTLTAVNAGGTWAGTGITNTSNGTFDPATAGAGTHQILYTTTGACPDTDTMNVLVTNLLDATISAAGPFCFSDAAVNLTAATAGGTWSGTGITNTTNGTFDPATAGIGVHEIIYATSGSCADSDTINITVADQMDASISAVGPFCETEAGLVLTAADAGGTWSGTGILNVASGLFDPATAGPGTHQIKYTIPGACGDADSINIVIYDSPDFTYVATDESCTGSNDGSIVLTVTGGVNPLTYTWSTGANTASVAEIGEGSYTVTVTDANGCTRNAAITLGDPGVPCDDIIPHAVVPNAFSPNGDGENDVLYVRGEGITQLSFIVYDRWGEKVFSTTTLNNGWDGTFRGKDLDPAVFTYYLHAIFIDGSDKIEKGDITLTR